MDHDDQAARRVPEGGNGPRFDAVDERMVPQQVNPGKGDQDGRCDEDQASPDPPVGLV